MRYLIPIAAKSELFPIEEFHFPKPLVEVAGKAIITRVINAIQNSDASAEFIFVVRKEDCEKFSLDASIRLSTTRPLKIVVIDTDTKGALCTALMACQYFNDGQPLVVCNGDQIIDCDLASVYEFFKDADAGVITFPSVHPRWSYAKTSPEGDVTETAEKRVISTNAIAGFYFFKTGSSFIGAAFDAIINSENLEGPFFISPVLNQIILSGGRVRRYQISEESYHSLYSPHRVRAFERHLENAAPKLPQSSSTVQFAIPMAGLGSRFSDAGYQKPKPFIDVAGEPMIARVMHNLAAENSRFILITRGEHMKIERETVANMERISNAKFVPIEFTTEGAACTVLLARPSLDARGPLVIANCDQIVDFDVNDFIKDAINRKLDGSILVFRDKERNPKWSFAEVNEHGLVDRVKEKEAISDLATVGIYYFREANMFFTSSIDMIANNDRTNGEFYVCPVYNYMIRCGSRVGVYEISQDKMHGIGTPEDLHAYINTIKCT